MGPTRTTTSRRRRQARAAQTERTIMGVPERFMRPRIVLIVVTCVLVLFGMLMIYSASSISCLTSETFDHNPFFYVRRQAMAVAVGTVAAVIVACSDYHLWTNTFIKAIWAASVLALGLILMPFASQDAYGATRWINIAGFSFQPAEFAKITVILTAANLCDAHYGRGRYTTKEFWKLMALGVLVPLVLIITQPDKGSTLIICATLVVMGYMAGVPRKYLLYAFVLGVAGFAFLSLKDSYSRARIITMFNPWRDYYGDGYQLIQGFYAFGTGGLFGLGLGFSRQKYSYLPMAHNDFIFAVIGEELGLVGTIGLLAAFALLLWAGLKIARNAPDMAGQLVALGCTSMLVIQLLLNISGVLGIFPLSGKPVPFISYGGSTVIACIILVGLVVSVSVHSALPETEYDRARQSLRVDRGRGNADDLDGYDDGDGLSFVGEATPRSARRGRAGEPADRSGGRGGFTMVDGGTGRGSSRQGSTGRGSGRTQPQRGRNGRIDLGPDASERLRGRNNGPRRRS